MLPDQSLPMPPQWRDLLEQAACGVFARRSTRRLFMALACGLILAGRGTVTGMAAAAGIGRQWRRACWFFSAASWDAGELGLAVARLAVRYLLHEGEPLTVAVDGTFFRGWGKQVFQARWAYDDAAQGGKEIAYATRGSSSRWWCGCGSARRRWRCRWASGCGAARAPPPGRSWPPRW